MNIELKILSHLDRVPFYFLEKLIKEDDLDVLHDLVSYIEENIGEGMRCSLFLKNTDSDTLRCFSAKSLPQKFKKQFQEIANSPNGGPSSRAAHFKTVIYSDNVASELNFPEGHILALEFGIHSCWCHPILIRDNLVGVFSLYFRQSHSAQLDEVSLMEGMVQIASLALERHSQREEEKRLLKALENSQQRFNVAMQARGMGVYDWDIENDLLLWDDSMYAIYGLKKENFAGAYDAWEKTVLPEDRDFTNQEVKLALAGKRELNTQFRIHKNGEVHHIRAAGVVLRNRSNEPIRLIGVNWDISKKVLAENELQQERAKAIASSKMAALGTMASGIAHEINNPLTIILAKATQAKSRIQKGVFDAEQVVLHLEKIESTVHRIAKIVRGLNTFSRIGDSDPFLPQPVSKVLEETVELCIERFRKMNILLDLQAHKGILIECRSTQIAQVVLNLLNNSYDAIAEQPGDKWVRIETVQNKNNIQIRVVDCGKGLPTPVAERIMEPFFTTKGVGKGTGLGLSISRGIVEDHHGSLWLDRSGRNTTFVIELPVKKVPLKSSYAPGAESV